MPTSPPSGRTRPLPRPPGIDGPPSASSYGMPGSVTMPEPQPYTPIASPSQTDFTHNRTSSSSTGRRLPPAPEGSVPAYVPESSPRPSSAASSIPDGVRSNGLPAYPRIVRPPPPPATSSFGTESSVTESSLSSSSATRSLHPYAVATPISDSPQLPSPNWSSQGSSDSRSPGANGFSGPALARTASGRPKGAGAPVVPGQTMSQDYSSSPTSTSSPDISLQDGGIAYRPPESPRVYQPYDASSNGYASSINGVNGADPYMRSSTEDTQAKGASSPAIGSGNGSLLEPTCQSIHMGFFLSLDVLLIR